MDKWAGQFVLTNQMCECHKHVIMQYHTFPQMFNEEEPHLSPVLNPLDKENLTSRLKGQAGLQLGNCR